jgi:hypothetical protein
LFGILGVLVLVPAPGRSQTARPAETVQAARALAPATAVVGARVGAQAKKPVAGKIVGVLTDAATGEPLIGGQVGVQGLPLGNVSDETGAYFINNVPVGKQTLTVEYLGYLPQSRELDVQPAGPTTVNFELTPEPIAGEEVVVEENSVADLSDYVERTPLPTLKPAPVTEPEIQHSDTTLMEEWHKSWRNFSQLYSIEYPMMGERVYFRRPPGVPPPSRATPAGDEVEASPEAEAAPPRAAQPAAASAANAPAKAGTPSAAPAKVQTASPAQRQLAEQPAPPDRALKPSTPAQVGR